MPKVSVVMSVYNEEKYLQESIESVLHQTLKDFEFVVINDASTDNSARILEKIAVNDERLRIINNEKRLGLTKSLNIAIINSKGKYIARMDADDVALPERLERQILHLEKNPSIGLIGTSFYEIDEHSRILGEVYMPETDLMIRKKIFKFNPFFHSSITIPRTVFEKVGLYNEEFQYAQDYELWFRILRSYKGINLNELLMKRRKHKQTLTHKKLQQQYYFSYKACQAGLKLLTPSIIDRCWLLKHKIISTMPSKLMLGINRLRSHNIKYIITGYYIRDYR